MNRVLVVGTAIFVGFAWRKEIRIEILCQEGMSVFGTLSDEAEIAEH